MDPRVQALKRSETKVKAELQKLHAMGSASREARLRSFIPETVDAFEHVLQYPPLIAAQEEERAKWLGVIMQTIPLMPDEREAYLHKLRAGDQAFIKDAWEALPDITNLAIILMVQQGQGTADFDELLARTWNSSPAAAGGCAGYAGALGGAAAGAAANAAPVPAQARMLPSDQDDGREVPLAELVPAPAVQTVTAQGKLNMPEAGGDYWFDVSFTSQFADAAKVAETFNVQADVKPEAKVQKIISISGLHANTQSVELWVMDSFAYALSSKWGRKTHANDAAKKIKDFNSLTKIVVQQEQVFISQLFVLCILFVPKPRPRPRY